ncbi:MAG: hypothetical protein K0S16_850, partial [Moraxellaceae bacterium]|nr:hypothetical protein [Moraxellaceae bacterium]
MSEPVVPAVAPLWPRDARPPAVPGRAPLRRHQPLPGVAGFDWLQRHRFARHREERFLAAALAAAAADVSLAAAAPGDIDLQRVRNAFAEACAACGTAPEPALLRRVLALLRGCYVVMPAADRAPAVALAAAVAARCGLAVHLICEEKEGADALLALVNQALEGSGIKAVAPGENAADFRLLTGEGARVVCTTASTLAHAWLRWSGEDGALARAAAWLGGRAAPVFSFAALLLSPDGERVLLDLLRHPLQLTREQAEDAAAFMTQLVQLTEAWQAGSEYADGTLLPRGEAALHEAARLGGLWAVPKLRTAFVQALLIARGCVAEQDFVLENGRLRWLVAPDSKVANAAQQAQVELALRCLHGQPAAQRVRRRAWFTDFFAGYAR